MRRSPLILPASGEERAGVIPPVPRARSPLFARGSLTLRMIVLASAIRRNFDDQLNYAATALIATAEVGPNGEARSSRPLSDQRFLEPYSGLYWQVSVAGAEPFRSRSLWDRALPWRPRDDCSGGCFYNTTTFHEEPLRVVERDALLPGAKTVFHFQVAQVSRDIELSRRQRRPGRGGAPPRRQPRPRAENADEHSPRRGAGWGS